MRSNINIVKVEFIAGWNQWKVRGFAEELCQGASTPLNVCRMFRKSIGELIPDLCVLWCMSRECLFHLFNCFLGALIDFCVILLPFLVAFTFSHGAAHYRCF